MAGVVTALAAFPHVKTFSAFLSFAPYLLYDALWPAIFVPLAV